MIGFRETGDKKLKFGFIPLNMSNSKISVYIRPRPIDDEVAWTITDDKKITKKDTGAPQFSFGSAILISC